MHRFVVTVAVAVAIALMISIQLLVYSFQIIIHHNNYNYYATKLWDATGGPLSLPFIHAQICNFVS